MDITLALIMGIVYAASPGPVNVETLRRGMQGGFLDSLAVQAGTSVGRIFYALLALFGAGVLLQGATMQIVLGVFGAIVLFYLGFVSIRTSRSLAYLKGGGSRRPPNGWNAFWTGALLSLASPLAAVFWLSVGSRFVHDPRLDPAGFLLGFFGGCILASVTVAFFASFWQSRLTARTMLALSWTCGLVLIGFGLRLGFSIGQDLIIW